MTADAPQPQPAPVNAKQRAVSIPLLVTILALALGLRLYNLHAEDLWLDEFFSVELSTGRGYADQHLPRNVVIAQPPDLLSLRGAPPWTAIWRAMREDTHPPLYFLALRGWRAVFGSSDVTIRMMSIVWSLLAIAALYLVGTMQFGPAPALWACLMMALAMPQIGYAQEARNNPMVLALGMASAAALMWVERGGAEAWQLAVLSTCVLATMLTHYYCIGAVAAMMLYALLVMRGRTRRRAIVALCITVAVYLLIWGPILRAQLPAFEAWHHESEPVEGHFGRTILRVCLAPLRQFIGVYTDSLPAAALTATACVSAAIALRRRRDLWLWWLWGGGVLAVLTMHDLRRTAGHLMLPKYALLAGPAIFLILSAGPMRLRGGLALLRHAIPAAAVVLCLCYLRFAYEPRYGRWSMAAQFLTERAAARDLIVFEPHLRADWSGGWNYLAVSRYLDRWPAPVMILDREPDDEVLGRIDAAGATRVFVVIDAVVGDPPALLPGWRPVDGTFVRYCGTVWRFARPSERVPPTTGQAATQTAATGDR